MVEAGRCRIGTFLILILVTFLVAPIGGFADDEVTIISPPSDPSSLAFPLTPSVAVKPSSQSAAVKSSVQSAVLNPSVQSIDVNPSDLSNAPLSLSNGEEVKVELLTEPSESEVASGGEFYLTFKIIYHGSDSYWHVKSIDGPSLDGAAQVSHAVSSSVRKVNDVVICEEIHKISFRATGIDVSRIGAVSVVLLGKGGAVRHLQSNPLEVNIQPSLFGGHLKIPVLWVFLSFVVFLLAVLLAAVFRVRRQRLLMEQKLVDGSSDLSQDEKVASILKNIEQMKSSSFDDVKGFYKKSLEIIKSGLELNLSSYDRDNADSFCFEDVPNMPASLNSGLKKVVSDENLVRFAGLKPSAEECDQVCSRLKEFITLNIDHG